MKTIIITFILLLSGITIFGQIGGLSATKLNSMSATVLSNNTAEFEPGAYHVRSTQYWNQDGDLQNIYNSSDSIRLVTGMFFRFTYGLWNKLEFGLSLSTDLDLVQMGARYAFLQKDKYGLALAAGYNSPLGNRTIDQRVRARSNIAKAGLGLIGSYYFTENLSIDLTSQYMHFLKEDEYGGIGAWYVNSDIGYYILDKQLQLMAGVCYHTVNEDFGRHEILTLYPGVSLETSKNFSFSFVTFIDVYGRAEIKNLAFEFAMTLAFD